MSDKTHELSVLEPL